VCLGLDSKPGISLFLFLYVWYKFIYISIFEVFITWYNMFMWSVFLEFFHYSRIFIFVDYALILLYLCVAIYHTKKKRKFDNVEKLQILTFSENRFYFEFYWHFDNMIVHSIVSFPCQCTFLEKRAPRWVIVSMRFSRVSTCDTDAGLVSTYPVGVEKRGKVDSA